MLFWEFAQLVFIGAPLLSVRLVYVILYFGTTYSEMHPGSSINGYVAFNSHIIQLLGDYLTLDIILSSVSSLIWIAIGLIIFWRKSDDWVALMIALGLVACGSTFSPHIYAMYVLVEKGSAWRLMITFVDVLGWGCVGLFFYLFPNGQFIPRWTRWIAPLYIAYQAILSLPVSSTFSIEQWPPLMLALVELSLLLTPVFAQIYRYRHFSNKVERQQTKWVVFGIVLTLLGDILLFLPPLFFTQFAEQGSLRSIYAFVSECLFPLLLPLIPITIGIALLRYRLWDIDIIINRALVYSTLTGTLALVYFGSIVILQTLLGSLTGGNNLAIVGSTLAIAALFQPLRRRVQQTIDRRFYRRKYDAAQTLKAFGAQLQQRDEVDMAALTTDLLTVVEETMQPAHISLWLHESASKGKHPYNKEMSKTP